MMRLPWYGKTVPHGLLPGLLLTLGLLAEGDLGASGYQFRGSRAAGDGPEEIASCHRQDQQEEYAGDQDSFHIGQHFLCNLQS